LEYLTLVRHHPSCHQETKDRIADHYQTLVAELPLEIVTTAQTRGQASDLLQVAGSDVLEMFANWEEEFSPPMVSTQRFVPESLIATGGMGEVYQGRDTETGQRVAIKRLKPALIADNPELVKRLVREGEALRRLNHPNIVQILAMVEDEEQPLVVMEYVSGGSLRERLEREPQLPLNHILDLSLELADALTRAHHLGILHRDIKPANVLLAADGSPRLTDFGVAHFSGQDTHLTQAGTILGTVAYLSPEACRGEVLDTRSDIWSFGVALFEMLTGQHPFGDEQLTSTLLAILNNPLPDLPSLRPDAPAALIALVQEMLVKEKAQRLSSMRQVAARLEMIPRK
jgi:serine/threonine-protein kinase